MRIRRKDLYQFRQHECMGLGQYMAKEFMKELGNRSKEFYEFIMPAIDMIEDGNDLMVIIDLPGFAKKDIRLRIVGNLLSINAKREPEENTGTVYYRQRPSLIERKIILPISLDHEDDEKVVGTAKYVDGVVILKVPLPMTSNIPII
ncbi:MAG TPA: archaeal heat shock protein Hsp14 [Nitrososphaeraceae archaeon]|nr:archaeal heat shock protein Hsp14 [Nitrososphaeraceae archaeon]